MAPAPVAPVGPTAAEFTTLQTLLQQTQDRLVEVEGRTATEHEKAAFTKRDAAVAAQRETQTALEMATARAEKAEAEGNAMLSATRKSSVLEVLARETGHSPVHLTLLYDGLVAQGKLESSPEDIDTAVKAALESLAPILQSTPTTGAAGQSGGFIPRDPGPASLKAKLDKVNEQRKTARLPPIAIPGV